MASKKYTSPSEKPPAGGGGAKSKNKNYLDTATRNALSKIDWNGVGRIMRDLNTAGRVGRSTAPKRASEGPKRSGAMRTTPSAKRTTRANGRAY